MVEFYKSKSKRYHCNTFVKGWYYFGGAFHKPKPGTEDD